jgi:DNA-binding MarR family transcriptional regulator
MSLKISGSLTYFPLINIIDFLFSTGSSGFLSIEKEGRKGEAYLCNGEIVHATYRNLFTGKEAFFKLFTVSEGNFYFKHIDTIPDRTLNQDMKELMGELYEKIITWEELKKIVTSEHVSFKLIPASIEFKDDEILLSKEQWLILTRLDGFKTVGEIAIDLSMEFIEISEIIADFFKSGYIQPVDMFETKEIEKREKTLDCSILSGDLKSFPLLTVLEFLSHLNMTGRLKLSRGIYQGELFIDKGELLHADNSIWDGEMALVDMLSWVKGKFSFLPLITDFVPTITTPVEEIILTCGEILSEWRKMQSIITDPDLIFIANLKDQEKDDDEKLTFSRRHWKVMYNIDGSSSIRHIAQKMKIYNSEAAHIVYSLYKDGLVEPVHTQIAEREIISEADDKIEKKKDRKKIKKFKDDEEKNPGDLKNQVDDLISVMDTVKNEPEQDNQGNILDR